MKNTTRITETNLQPLNFVRLPFGSKGHLKLSIVTGVSLENQSVEVYKLYKDTIKNTKSYKFSSLDKWIGDISQENLEKHGVTFRYCIVDNNVQLKVGNRVFYRRVYKKEERFFVKLGGVRVILTNSFAIQNEIDFGVKWRIYDESSNMQGFYNYDFSYLKGSKIIKLCDKTFLSYSKYDKESLYITCLNNSYKGFSIMQDRHNAHNDKLLVLFYK